MSLAANGGYEAIVRLLLETNEVEIDPIDDEYGRTPLSWAVDGRNEAVVGLLLESGANIDSIDKLGQSPLWWAAEQGHEKVARLLLDTSQTNVDQKDYKCANAFDCEQM